jgi:excisionase family DNA binding protein
MARPIVRRTVSADPVYDVYEVAIYLKCHHSKVRALVASGDLASTRVGSLIRVPLSAITAYLNADRPARPVEKPGPKGRPLVAADCEPLSLIEAWQRREERRRHA